MIPIAMPITTTYRILHKTKDSSRKGSKEIVMISINEEEENLLDNIKDKVIKFTRGNRTFSIKSTNIFCYGEVDFNSKEDLITIDKFKFLGDLIEVGKRIYSNYDYNSHTCTSYNGRLKWTETFSCSNIAKYAHGCLNKPKRIILFYQ